MPDKYVVDPSLIATLSTTYKRVNSSILPATACARCTEPHCCSYWVPVMDIEALIICQTYPEEVQVVWDCIVERVLHPPTKPATCVFRDKDSHGGRCTIHAHAPRNCRLYWVSALERPGDCHPDIARKREQVYGRIVIPTVHDGVERMLREESYRLDLPTGRDTKYLEVALARMMVLLDPKLAEVFMPNEQVVMDSLGTVEPVFEGQAEQVLDILDRTGGGRMRLGDIHLDGVYRDAGVYKALECTEDCGKACDQLVCDAVEPAQVE